MKAWITALGITTLTALVCALIVTMSGGPEAPTPQAERPTIPVRRLPPPSPEAPRFADEAAPTAAAEVPGSGGEATAAAPPPPTPAVMRDRIGLAFDAEHLDSAWTGAELARLEKALPALLPQGSQLRRVECRSTMCRIESSHASVDQFGDFVQRAFINGEARVNQSGFFAGLLAEPTPGQPVVTVAYIARQGHALPMPDRLASAP
jgi:hypothetical protein